MKHNESGFVLATSLVMLLLMTMLTAAVFVGVDSSQKSSMAAESSTEAFYYAETAANYMGWAMFNDAEFDSYTYPDAVKSSGEFRFEEADVRGTDPALDPLVDPYAYLPVPLAKGDFLEWRANRGNPSGDQSVATAIGADVLNSLGLTAFGQIMYYDNAPLNSRAIAFKANVLSSNGVAGEPELFGIHTSLPRYIRLDIDAAGNITPSIPIYSAIVPHHGDVEGVDYPTNGALVWVTGGNRTDDLEIDPIDDYYEPLFNLLTGKFDPVGAYTGTIGGFLAGSLAGGPLTCTSAPTQSSIACSKSLLGGAGTGTWVTDADYGLVIYAIGYVRGRPQKLVRVIY
ncbi:MAG: hypothetical protein R8M14_02090 [Ghiorsea sp.]